MKKKLSQIQKLRMYCVKNGHAQYVYTFWWYVYCGRCGEQIGDRLAGIFDLTDRVIIGCKDKPCKVCDPVVKTMNVMDKQIYRILVHQYFKNKYGIDHEKAIQGVKIK